MSRTESLLFGKLFRYEQFRNEAHIFSFQKKLTGTFFRYHSRFFVRVGHKTIYRTRAIISRSRFEVALVYKPRILSFKKESRNNGRSAAYSGVQIRWQRVFWAGNQGIHQNFDKSLLTYKC